MQVFISNEQNKSLKRKKRKELDPKETSAFLNRPVKKLEDLNQNLKNSYTKDFFKGPRFEHFETLKKLRKGQDNDSILSSDHNDEDYKQLQSKKRISFLHEPQMPKKVTEARLESRKIKEKRSRSRQAIPAGKSNKKMAKRPPIKKIESSSSSSSYKSSLNGSLERSHNDSVRQKDTKKVDPSLTDEKLDSATKQEVPAKPESSFSPQKHISISKKENSQTQKYSSSELSDEPEHILPNIPKAQSVNLMDKIINKARQSENEHQTEQVLSQDEQQGLMQVESSIESVEMVLDEEQDQIAKEQQPDTGQVIAILSSNSRPIDPPRSSQLTINSKVIVESFYIRSSPSIQAQPTQFNMNLQEQLAKLFVHAPCCIYSQGRQNERGEESQSEEEDEPQKSLPKKPVSNMLCSAVSQKDQKTPRKSSFRKKTYTKGVHESCRYARN